MITSDESVAPPDSPAPARARRRWLRILLVVAVLTIAVVVGGSIRTPYYALSPGSVIDVAALVDVQEGPRFEPAGSMEMVTVAVGRTTVFGLIRGWLDDDVEVVDADRVKPPGVSDQEFDRYNEQLMASSKEAAVAVAFETLGEDAIRGAGARIAEVIAGSPADGVLAEDEVVVAIDGEPVELSTDLVNLVAARAPGDEVTLSVRAAGAADGALRDVAVRLGHQAADPTRPQLGVSVVTDDLRIELPRAVVIDSRDIGGPSAGLAFALQVLDELTPGELTGGRRIAATGTIGLDGTVGQIGGIEQKTAAVIRAGIDVFLVPTAEYEAARRRAGDDLRVIPVDDLDGALDELASLGGDGLRLRS